MSNQHPITPPLELQDKWRQDWYKSKVKHIQLEDHIATQAARWGADQELEACCEQVAEWQEHWECKDERLRAVRRPKPPSLKEQALALVRHNFSDQPCLSKEGYALIRRALEALPNE